MRYSPIGFYETTASRETLLTPQFGSHMSLARYVPIEMNIER